MFENAVVPIEMLKVVKDQINKVKTYSKTAPGYDEYFILITSVVLNYNAKFNP